MKTIFLIATVSIVSFFAYSAFVQKEQEPINYKFLAFPENTPLYNSATFAKNVGTLDTAIIVTDKDIKNGYKRLSYNKDLYVKINDLIFIPHSNKETSQYLKKWKQSLKNQGYVYGHWRTLNTSNGGYDIMLKLVDSKDKSEETLIYNLKDKRNPSLSHYFRQG